MSRFNVGDEVVLVNIFNPDYGREYRYTRHIGATGTIESIGYSGNIYVYFPEYGRSWDVHESSLSLVDGYKQGNSVERKIKQMWERQPFVKRRAA